MKNKRGQLVVYDFIFGFTAFIVVVTIVAVMWFQSTSRVGLEDDQDIKFRLARGVVTSLVMTPGYPENWEFDNDCTSRAKNCTLGLAYAPNRISLAKLNAFIDMHGSGGSNYDEMRGYLNLNEYYYSFSVRNAVGTRTHHVGVELAGNLSVSITRKVVIDGEIRTIEFGIY